MIINATRMVEIQILRSSMAGPCIGALSGLLYKISALSGMLCAGFDLILYGS